MIETFAIICGVTVIGALAEDFARKESTKEVIRIGTFALNGALAIGLVIKVVKTVKTVINGD